MDYRLPLQRSNEPGRRLEIEPGAPNFIFTTFVTQVLRWLRLPGLLPRNSCTAQGTHLRTQHCGISTQHEIATRSSLRR